MSSRTWTDITGAVPAHLLAACVLLAALSGCSMFKSEKYTFTPDGGLEPTSEATAKAKKSASQKEGQSVPATAGGAPPERVKQRFEHAVSLMQSGNTEQAEIELRDVMLLAPQQAAPVVDLSILYRKQGKLEEAEQLLRTSASQSANAMVLTELGFTQRLRGEFRDAQASYEKAIAADPKYAPAYRDLGVVADVYLGDAPRALSAFEHYEELAGQDKAVSNWIAELRVRTGQKPAPKAADAAPAKADAANASVAAKADPAPAPGKAGAAAPDAAASADADAPAPKARKAAKPRKAAASKSSSAAAASSGSSAAPASAGAADPPPPAKPQ